MFVVKAIGFISNIIDISLIIYHICTLWFYANENFVVAVVVYIRHSLRFKIYLVFRTNSLY